MNSAGRIETFRPYVDADGLARWCESCGASLSPNILDNYWIHNGDAACPAVTDDHGIQRYNRHTADTHFVGKD
jgi:hypothetical protein